MLFRYNPFQRASRWKGLVRCYLLSPLPPMTPLAFRLCNFSMFIAAMLSRDIPKSFAIVATYQSTSPTSFAISAAFFGSISISPRSLRFISVSRIIFFILSATSHSLNVLSITMVYIIVKAHDALNTFTSTERVELFAPWVIHSACFEGFNL